MNEVKKPIQPASLEEQLVALMEIPRRALEGFWKMAEVILAQKDELLKPGDFSKAVELHKNLTHQMGNCKAANKVQQYIIGKAITSLKLFCLSNDVQTEEFTLLYFTHIESELRPNRFGVGSHLCTQEESLELIDELLEVAKVLKHKTYFERIAVLRFGEKDRRALAMFLYTHFH